jgi:hypothetical protein
MKKSLYEITNDYSQLMNEIEMNEGEITPELNEALTITEKELQTKSIAYLSVIKQSEAFISQLDEEIKRLQALKKRNNNLVDNLKSRLLDAVKLFGVFEVGFTKFGTRKSTSVQVDDVNSLPQQYKTVKVTEAADKTEIGKALKSGVEVNGCSLVENLNLKIN